MSKPGPVSRHKLCQKLPHVSNLLIRMSDILTPFFMFHNLGMEPNDEPTAPPPPCTPLAMKYKVGDLVDVFQGTAAYVRGRNTVAFVGRIVGYNTEAGKWEVQRKP
jgi:hypothetical protein